jgi:hypothetical protein
MPRLVPAFCTVVVEGQDLRTLFRSSVRPLHDLGDAAMELTSPLERKAVVRRITYQRMAEAEGAGHVGVALHVLAETIPRLRAGGDVRIVLEHLGDQ